ncbi:alpha/beta hydrolase-fold protein [Pseudonocardia ailaonensis]|uniref:Alpha/beta hydrolase-fold protein n=1 Tax=Pseudonocardia ailaonensis TaxID=367279 RepID=A0ABN2MTK2_9PSEU
MLDWSLFSGAFPTVIVVVGIVAGAGLALFGGIGRRWWFLVVPAVIVGATAVTFLLLWLVTDVWRPFPDRLPTSVWVWGGIAVAAVGLAVAVQVLAGRGRVAWLRRIAAVLAAALVAVTAAQSVNLVFQAYPTTRTALGIDYPDQQEFADTPTHAARLVRPTPDVPLEQTWTPPAGLSMDGRVAQVQIPATTSGFPARPAWVYLPPAYLSTTRAQLPVLVLLSGQPGDTNDWLNGGRLSDRMDRYAAEHHGLAPVVVMPDDTGGQFANPLCMDSKLGNAATYLTVDVPAWIRRHLQVNPDPAAWSVGGFSYGGTCALQLALTAPGVYPTLVDISGQQEPTLGDRATTVRAAFGTGPDAEARFKAVNPLDLLATRRFPQLAAAVTSGDKDAQYQPAARRIAAALQAAGVATELTIVPGGHNYEAWGAGLEAALPWLGRRLKIS